MICLDPFCLSGFADGHVSCAQILGGVFPLFGLQMYNALGLVSSNHPADGYQSKRRLTVEQYVLPQSFPVRKYHPFKTTYGGKSMSGEK
jgi:hypothetical protein